MLLPVDYIVIGFYFAFLTGLGWYFRHAGANSSEYFRGGGRMPWWLVGTTAFMGLFSAWTFTGAAGLAYDHGLVVLVLYWANAGTWLLAACCFGAWFRQLRVVTVMEAVRQRLGRTNEQVFTWLEIPMRVLIGGIWLYGLAIFISPVLQLDLHASILLCGAIVIVVVTLGGSWAVAAGDFMQTLLLVPVTLLTAWFALRHVGGVGPLMDGLPPTHFDLSARTVSGYGFLWLAALALDKIVLGNRLTYVGTRFFFVKDGASARRASLLAASLFGLGSLVWFIPPLAARAMGVDLAARFPSLRSPGEAAFVVMAIDTLPPGVLGLLVTAMIAATLSSLNESLNGNAGIFVRSVYRPLLRPHAAERELVRAGRAATMVMGSLVVLLALQYSTWREFGVLKLMFNFSAMIAVPSAVPIFWCVFTRRVPDWSAWSTVLVGFAVSAGLGVLPRQPWCQAWLAAQGYGETLLWLRENEYGVITLAVVVVGTLWFWSTRSWADARSPQREREVQAFFTAMHTPVTAAESGGARPDDTLRPIARLCFIYAGFLAVVCALPNSLRGRGGLAFCMLFFLFVGALLRRASARGRTLIEPVGGHPTPTPAPQDERSASVY